MGKIKILLVDDDALFGASIVEGLKLFDIDVLYQTSLIALSDVINSANPHLVLMDVEVGVNNSINELRHIKETIENIPVIFMSGHPNMKYLSSALGEGGVSFLKKPFEIDELVAYIKRFAKTENEDKISFGGFSLNKQTHDLYDNLHHVTHLTNKQFQLLETLLANQSEVIPRESLKQKLWKDGNSSDASLDNYVSQLRKICSSDDSIKIETVPKKGFLLKIL